MDRRLVAGEWIDGRLVEVELPPIGEPLVPLESRQQRRAWQRRYDDFVSQYGMHPDLASYHATANTLRVELERG